MSVLLLGAALAAIASIVGLRLAMDGAGENRLRPGEDAAIAELRSPLPGNAFLACPPGYCAAEAATSPVSAAPVSRLYRAFADRLANEPRITVVRETAPRRMVLIQRSAVFHFPDLVVAEFVDLPGDRSSVALYSRARYGRLGFGVNRQRVETWLARLERYVPAQ